MADQPARSVPEDVRDALLSNHPLVRAGEWMARGGQLIEDAYASVKKALTPAAPRRRRGDIYLPPERRLTKGRPASPRRR